MGNKLMKMMKKLMKLTDFSLWIHGFNVEGGEDYRFYLHLT
jgi:hypothetical protein